MVDRRALITGAMGLSLGSMTERLRSASQAATPADEIDKSVEGVITIAHKQQIAKGIELLYLRFVDESSSLGSPGVVLVLGGLLNSRKTAVDVPWLGQIVLRDKDKIIVGSGPWQAVYPILPPNEPIGFTAIVPVKGNGAYAPELTRVDLSLSDFNSTVAVARLAERTVRIDDVKETPSDASNLIVSGILTNTSGQSFGGAIVHAAVTDRHGYYCAYAFENILTAIGPGDRVRFETHASGSFINPMAIAGTDYTWKLFVEPV